MRGNIAAGRTAAAKAPEERRNSPGLRNSEEVSVAAEKPWVEF